MSLSLIRKIASLLLLLCFVLPLSTCESKRQPQQEVQPPTQSQAGNTQTVQENVAKDKSLYGYVLLSDGWDDLRKNKTPASSMTMFAVIIVFFLPCCLLTLREKVQAIISLLASVVASYVLFIWVFFCGTPRVGGMLAITCWSSLFLISLIFSWRWALQWWRKRKRLHE